MFTYSFCNLLKLCLEFFDCLYKNLFCLFGNYLFLCNVLWYFRILGIQKFKELCFKSCNILNRDIQLTADTLRDLADWMDQHPDVVMARPALVFPDGRPQQLPLRRCALRPMVYRQLPALRFWAKYNDAYLMKDKDLTRPTEIEFCTGSFSAVRTRTFRAVGGFDEKYFMYVEDADLTQKMRTQGKAYLVPQFTAIHAWHRAAHRSLKPALWQTSNLLRYFSKWGFRW